MRLELKRGHLLMIPEGDADKAYIEDTLRITEKSPRATIERIHDVKMGFADTDSFVLKLSPAKEEAKG